MAQTWKKVVIRDHCEITSSKRIFASDYRKEGVPFYRSREVIEKHNGSVDVRTELFIAEDKFTEIEARFGAPAAGELLLTSVGTLGIPYLVKAGERFYFKDGNLTWFRKFKDLDSRFLYHWLLSPQGKGELKKCTIGSSQSAFTIVLLKGMEIDLPPISVQHRIATILSAYDDLIANNLRRIKNLEEMARLLYREWFVEFKFPGHEKVPRVASAIGLIPKGWEAKAIPDAIEINPRVSVGRDGEYPFAPMGCLANDSMLITDIESRVGNSGSKFQNGDTLFARITPCLENGKTGFVQFLPDRNSVACGSTEFIVLRSRTVTPEFVYLLARSEEFRANAIKSMSGASGRQRVQERCFDSFHIAEPPRPLLDRFSAIVAPSFSLIQGLDLENDTLRRTRDLLLPRLFSGQVPTAPREMAKI